MPHEQKIVGEVKIIQININHCEAAHDLLSQTLREIDADIAVISEPYKKTAGPNYILGAKKLSGRSAHPDPNNCYLPPRLTLPDFTSVLDKLVDDARGKRNVVIDGDFNAWAEEWGSAYTNARGKTLLETNSSLDVALLNTRSEHTFRRGGAGSVVDLTFCSSSLFKQAQKSTPLAITRP
ncbi:uncharacterized protein [Drosophila takahashii]|uniref:uncharacterized protein n=1 Tax=Drosophila takahashii TaxID=29030 RepID=UPI00389959A6